MKRRYRETWEIIYAILSLLANKKDLRISHITTKVNVAHRPLGEMLDTMYKKGWIETRTEFESLAQSTRSKYPTRFYNITLHGRNALDLFSKFKHSMEDFILA